MMYTVTEMEIMCFQPKIYQRECEKYCLFENDKSKRTFTDLIYYANFVILQSIDAYKHNFLDIYNLRAIYDKIDSYVYSADMLDIDIIVNKLRNEILVDVLDMEILDIRVGLCND